MKITDDLRYELSRRALDIVRHLLGAEPTSRSKHEVRFGRNGSFSLIISGPKQGCWFDHEAGEGGDVLALIERELRVNFGEAVEWGASFVGHRETTAQRGPHPRRSDGLARKKEEDAAREREDAKKVQQALEIWDGCVPIDGTPAYLYLSGQRAIPGTISSLTVRYHPVRRAVVFAVLEPSNAFVGVQLVRIYNNGRKHPGPKLAYGTVGKGTAVFFADWNSTDLVVAEGPETGLSIAACTGLEVRCTLGPLKRYTPQPGRNVIAAADDDPWGSTAHSTRTEAVRNWEIRGTRVYVAHPWPLRREDKSDFNDLLKADGPDAVRARINVAMPRPAIDASAPELDVGSARVLLDVTVRGLLND